MLLSHVFFYVSDVPQALQKVMFKGLAKDDKTLRDIGITKGAKVMVVGSKLNEVMAVSTPTSQVKIIQYQWRSYFLEWQTSKKKNNKFAFLY